MKAMLLEQPGRPLVMSDLPRPEPAAQDVLLKVLACGVCRTDLHIVDGELKEPSLPLILGHQIVGLVQKTGPEVSRFAVGDRVGVPWLGETCGRCQFCGRGQENLCEKARFTGYTRAGGFAHFTTAHEQFCFAIPEGYPDTQAAPLLCAGLIGYRAYRFAGEAPLIGLYGFGAAAHILCQVAVHQGRQVMAFTRPGDRETQAFARSLGAVWAGGSDQLPPDRLDAALIFAPAGHLVPLALKAVKPGGKVICAGIHMSDIPAFPYHLLWGERSLQSVANLTRQDGEAFLRLAPDVPVQTKVSTY
ncbi:MAG: zinc-dependent alcohol dehydrogenase family protein, partial [Anaerolineae bacterium]|nr:zinc-dependent alcohol dehydrogenase family protein [Anaerolineae bacterium]